MKKNEKKERKIVRSTNWLDDYRNWECKELKCIVTNKLFDQINYVCRVKNMTRYQLVKKAVMYYLENVLPNEYDTSKMYVRKIEETKVKNPNERKDSKRDVENYD